MQDTTVFWKLLATAVFVVLNGFFVAAEFGLVKVRPARVDALAREGDRRAAIVQRMLSRLDLYLSACQLGITIASLVLGWLAEPAVARLLIELAGALGWEVHEGATLHWVAIGLALAIITILHMTVGEQAPKVWAIQRAESIALLVAYPLYGFATALRPLIAFINLLSNGLLRFGGISLSDEHEVSASVEELRSILASSARAGYISARQRSIGDNVLALIRLEVRHIMLPRVDVAYLSTASTFDENLQVLRETGHSRYPLGDPDLDNIRGVVLARTVLAELLQDREFGLEQLARPMPTVPEMQPLSRFIVELQRSQTHAAAVVDEHGTTIGLAFLEDALEEIVGPIYDEFDEQAVDIAELSSGVFELAGNVPLPEAADLLGISLDESEADTIAGYVIATLARIPKRGDSLPVGNYKATVLQVLRHRIVRLRFERIEQGEPF
ncbi:MAG: hemolysin family protein [Polyangiales bacterium]